MTRRQLGPAWPLLSELYGLHPWDLARLTYDEVDVYEAAARAAVERAEAPRAGR